MSKENAHWIKIKLIGNVQQKVNRDAIGARIILTTENGQTIWREIHGSIGYMSVHPKIQHFGLGEQTIKNIKVFWPNGEVQVLNSVKPNREYRVTQGSDVVVIDSPVAH